MISHLMSNATFSTAINQANNKSPAQVNTLDDKQKTKETTKMESKTDSKVDTIKDAIKNGTYKLDLKGSAEKLAQELLG
ncbi:flagellar biosynthesis anti-sigma factor FlgM [Helicobacter sp.]|uniref:flagellar biosynthesis anti-sigma factor FlgM n=1 Tax=Helicobacter sp. TaxID=218 RepID=UPI0025C64600|nr:flagellar biosynthesis anti-sigma factor FlgM [Helicobacter sp.]MCI5968961.1 flagellar biosynthesis anti-sigma factor FlgM [Helicobacter sp.]MDY2584293.1 flagellar biosynthesis anti-sigma factor FlgM [Helicobacter sp.]